MRPRSSVVSDGVEMVEVAETGRRGWGGQSDGEVAGSGGVSAGGGSGGAEDVLVVDHSWMAGVALLSGFMILNVVSGC